jgi:hypothetical protein
VTVYAFSRIPAFNPNTNPASVAKSATGSVYDLGDTGFLTPLNLTLVATNTVTTSLISDANGMFPDFTLVDRTQCAFKSGTQVFILTTTTPIPGPPSTVAGPTGPPGPATTDASLLSAGTVADARLPVTAQAATLSATYLSRATKTVADPGPASDTNLVVTGLNRSAAGGSSGIIRGEAQAASLLLNNNVGLDLTLNHAYEAIQFTVPAGPTTFGAVNVRLKIAAGTPGTATLTGNIYNDVSGAPGVIQALNNASTVIYAGSLSSTAYSVFEFLVRVNSASPTNYWIVFTTAGLGAGSFTIDTAAAGAGNYSYSANGTAWTAVPGSKPYLELRGQTNAGIQGTSENYVGVRGDSVSYYGVYGNTVAGIGAHGGSTHGVGVEGISANGTAGVYGIGSNGYGVYGTGTNNAGVYGTSPNAMGVQGVSANANQPGVEGDSTNTGAGVYGSNNSTGPAMKAESLSGNGPALHAIGHLKSTFGYPAAAAAGANAGTTPPAPVLTWPGANDIRGTVTFGTGTVPAAGAQAVITFGKVYDVAPTVVICPANAATAALQPYITATGTGGFTVALGLAPAASQANTVYAVSYFVFS